MEIWLYSLMVFKNLVSVALQVSGQRLLQKLAVECFSCKAANGFTQRLI